MKSSQYIYGCFAHTVWLTCFSFTYIVLHYTVIHPENYLKNVFEKYLNFCVKYFPMYLYLNTFVFKSICISILQEYLYCNTFQCIWPHPVSADNTHWHQRSWVAVHRHNVCDSVFIQLFAICWVTYASHIESLQYLCQQTTSFISRNSVYTWYW